MKRNSRIFLCKHNSEILVLILVKYRREIIVIVREKKYIIYQYMIGLNFFRICRIKN